ncbi:Chitinase A1 precursor [Flavobacterium columnare]|uniref:Chitinase A1 n=2 Tax=Flavobacterium TaxID=237 RepID=A0A2N9PDI2_9FLAO|nr:MULTISPECIES: endonuclease [Flavobacterium]QYS88852.1 endonuclease [Flavobacterium davisii]RVU90048.1 T9SS C-terminal target domain-containing protein [Flavobacterium columnare]SPE78367.1 Chitinase A1 precursor [Flavobacterium columnare]
MKSKTTLFALFCALVGHAQAPSGYYSSATGSGYTLKTQLYNIIKGHTDNGYSGLWTTYQTSDRDKEYENDNSIIDVYSENPTGTDPYVYQYGTNQCGTYSVEGGCYNREHMIPQSVFNNAAPMVSDAHFIPPTDGKVNGMRSNYPHGMVAVASWTSRNGGKLGSSAVSGYTGTVFEPINEFKGDIARMYFYFATRYENTVANYTSYEMFNGTSNQVFGKPFLDMLLKWHAQDPVSPREIARNNAIYARQGNRNPFIDNPNYVNLIWGGSIADTTAPSIPSNLISSGISTTSCTLSWTASTDNVGVTSYNIYLNGALKITVAGTSANITGLTASTTYSFTVKAKDAAGNTSDSSNALNVTTTAGTDIIAPTVPNNLTVSNVTTTGCVLSWAASTDNVGVIGYDIYQGTLLKTSVIGTTATITGLSASTNYSFTVRAKDAAGNTSDSSNALNVTTTAGTDIIAPTVPNNLTVSNITTTGCVLSWAASTDNVGVIGYDIYQGTLLKTSVIGTTATITGLSASTNYSFTVRAKDAAGNTSGSSNVLNVTTTASTTAITNLYFSEYLEGTSNNKALEITNRTGSPVSLSSYAIKKQTNGSGSWSTGLTLSGTLDNNGKFVIVNSLISSTCYSTALANLSTSAGEMAYNGNDAIGLFKNGVLVDIIGKFNGGTADFSIDETMRRKATAIVPSTTFNKTNDWDIYSVDNCSGLGNRVVKSNENKKDIHLNLFPNPTKGNFQITFEDLAQKYTVEIYTTLGQKIYEITEVTSESIFINDLPKGIYLVKINQNENSTTKRVVVE